MLYGHEPSHCRHGNSWGYWSMQHTESLTGLRRRAAGATGVIRTQVSNGGQEALDTLERL